MADAVGQTAVLALQGLLPIALLLDARGWAADGGRS